MTYDEKIQIIIIGESGVGKTSIINRLTKNIFDILTVSTISEYFCEKEIDIKGTLIKLQIWDTAGEEKFRSLISNYYNGAAAAILVYDITSKNSFEEMKNLWYKEINKYSPNISM